MDDTKQLRSKRIAGEISGAMLCAKVGISRSRLSDIERGYASPSLQQLARIHQALDELIAAKRRLKCAAAECGWPVSAI
jgi:transcriptional regulator with XRE-family HTH domain